MILAQAQGLFADTVEQLRAQLLDAMGGQGQNTFERHVRNVVGRSMSAGSTPINNETDAYGWLTQVQQQIGAAVDGLNKHWNSIRRMGAYVDELAERKCDPTLLAMAHDYRQRIEHNHPTHGHRVERDIFLNIEQALIVEHNYDITSHHARKDRRQHYLHIAYETHEDILAVLGGIRRATSDQKLLGV